MSGHQRAILMLVITMVIWGSTFVVTKGVITEVPPFTLAFLRVAIGAAALSVPAFLRRRALGRERHRAPHSIVFVMALVGVALYYGLFNGALLYTSASQAALVQSCIPAVTALVAAVWLRERASTVQWIGIVTSIAGVIFIFSGQEDGGGASMVGGLLMFATTIVWGVYTALGKQVAAADALDLTARMAAIGAMLLLPIAALEIATRGLPRITPGAWVGIVYLGAVASGIAYLLYNAALEHVTASEAGVYTNLIPIVGLLSGILVLGEPLSAHAIFGGCVVLLGVWLTSRRSPDAISSSRSFHSPES
ncbi:MAG: DMT family transporter [Steroidobacteraceae bacterium]